MLSLDSTEEGITVCGRFARRIPKRSWLLSFLVKRKTKGLAMSATSEALTKLE
jgi:hypothetical protein